jgi:uncharacterized repeat protein (TIGR01451 family)
MAPSTITRQQRRARERTLRKALAAGALLAATSATGATFTVTTLNDSGAGSLRDAITQANLSPGLDTIDVTVSGTLALTSGQLNITDDLTINGPGTSSLTIDAGNTSGIFYAASSPPYNTTPVALTVNQLTLTNAHSHDVPAIRLVNGTLAADHVNITGSYSYQAGAVQTSGASVALTNVTISGCSSVDGGGAVYVVGGSLALTAVNISGGYAYYGAGAIRARNGATITGTGVTISSCNAKYGAGAIGTDGGSLTLDQSSVTGTNGYYGGAIGADQTNVALTHVTVSGCSSTGDGGAINLYYGNLSLDHCTISGNTAGFSGGGIYFYPQSLPAANTLYITNSTISNNTCLGNPEPNFYNLQFGDGGGLLAFNYAPLYLKNVTFSGNTAAENGGGLEVFPLDGGSATILNCIIQNNTSGAKLDKLGRGGGMYLGSYLAGPVTVKQCVIAGNIADPNDAAAAPLPGSTVNDVGRGGGLFLTDIDATIQETTITGNTALMGGGVQLGIHPYFQDAASSTFENVTIANNFAKNADPGLPGQGGGINIEAGGATTAATLNECTVTGNSAQTGGGGLDLTSVNTANESITLRNTIVANNTSPSTTPDVNDGGGTVTANYSLIKTPGTAVIGGANNITGQDPQLAALATNGNTALAGDPAGPQQTPQTEMQAGTSPVVNAGDPAFTPPPDTDERGAPRVGGGRIDMGAVELQPAISITAPAPTAEGNGGTTPFTFTVTLDSPSAVPVTIDYTTVDGTATVADGDYLPQSGTLTIPANSTSQPITVFVYGDTKFEPNETFSVNLSNPSGASLTNNTATATILNDDPLPSISVNSISQNESNSGTTPFTFTVSLSNPSSQTVTVSYATADGTASVADSDYAPASGTLMFAPGVVSQTVTVNVNGDTKFEPNETFTLNLSAPGNATLGTASGTGTIQNDDAQPSVSIDSVSQSEGNSGTTPFAFTVSLSNPSSQTVTVNYTTADGTATVADGDYAAASGTLTFAPGVLAQPITVNVNGDTKFEPDETFAVNLSAPSNATLGTASGTGTIQNDDAQPAVSIDSVSQNEGNSGTTPFAFTVSLSNPSSQTVTVNYTTADGTASVADSDYTAAGGTLTFAPGVLTQPITVNVNGDTKFESNETFTVNLTGPSNATLGTSSGTGTIQNDDPLPSISIDNVSQNEGNSGTTPFVFTVTLSNASSQTVTASYTTADGTATVADNDYAAASGTLTFPPGVLTQPITVNVNGDTTLEPNETFTVDLSAPSNATLLAATGTGTIFNDDGNLLIDKGFGSASIPLGGSTTLTFTVQNNAAAQSQTNVAFNDALPAGLVVATPNGLTGSCGGGTITATQGTNSVSLSGATLASSSSCTFSIDVTGVAAGMQNNNTSNVTSNETPTGGVATANISVEGPPSIAKAFSPTAIPVNGTSSLTFTIVNPAANADPLFGVVANDTLPAGLTVTDGASNVCGGTLTTTAPGSISLTEANIPTGGQCQFSVTVTGTATGSYTNTTAPVTSSNGGTGNTASASLDVATAASIAKAFGATSIPQNGSTPVTFTLNNPNATALTGVGFNDALPSGLIVSTPNGLTATCTGTINATSGGGTISLTGGSLAASSACTISVNITGTAAGVFNNTTGPLSSTEGGTGTPSNTASITVVGPPAISKAFGAASIAINGSTALSFTITNSNSTTTLTGVAFSDTLPAGLVVSTPNGLTGSCGGGTITATAGSGSISLSGATIAAAGNCAFSVDITGTTAGGKTNTTGNVTSANGGSGGTATASISVQSPDLTIAKSHTGTFSQGQTGATYSIVISNAGAAASSGTVTVTDTLPAGLTATAMSGTGWTCTLATLTCTRSDALAATASYPSITLTVTVAGTASGTVTNSATVSGGADANASNNTANDATTIVPVTANIPTLSPEMLALLAVLLALIALRAVKD